MTRIPIALAILLSLLLGGPPPAPSAVYVASYGTAQGDGSPERPLTLAWAMASAPAGSTVWLLPGTYPGDATITAAGVTFRSVPGTRAKIDGGLIIAGANDTLRDVEILDLSWTTRATVTSAQQARYVGVTAPNVAIVNCWIHDLARGVEAFNGPGGASAGLSLRGNLIYNIGWSGHGHDVYAQNDDAGRKVIAGNVFGPAYGYGLHLYGSSTATIRHFDVTGNVLTSAWLIGGPPVRDIVATDNTILGQKMQIGYGGAVNRDVTLTANRVIGYSLEVKNTDQLTVTGNLIHNLVTYTPVPSATVAWDGNAYLSATFDIPGEGFRNLAAWQTRTGFDAHSSWSSGGPNLSVVQPNADDPNRGIVTILNWSQAPTVTADLSPLGLTAGARYQLINARNPAERLAFVAGAPLSVPMAGWTVATPYGAAAPLAGWDPRFGVWLITPA